MATMMESHSQQRRPSAGNRPRSKSAFSITSDKSERSEGAKNRESQDEKHKLAFSNTTKANPNAAMNELQPSELAFFERSYRANVLAVEDVLLIFVQLLNNKKNLPSPHLETYSSSTTKARPSVR